MIGRPQRGWVDRTLRAELPSLALVALPVVRERGDDASPAAIRARLERLAGRLRGTDALALRRRPVPHAYRAFYRHVGLDPDATRVAAEAVAIDCLVRGGLPSQGLLADARTIALVETDVPVWALDRAHVTGRLGLRLAARGETAGGDAHGAPLAPGQIVVADERAPIAPLFEEPGPLGAARDARRLLLFAVAVAGVPVGIVERALAICAEMVAG